MPHIPYNMLGATLHTPPSSSITLITEDQLILK